VSRSEYAAEQADASEQRNRKALAVTDTRKLDPIPDAQAYIGGIGRTTLYELAKAGHLKIVKIGARAFVTRESLDAYVQTISLGEPLQYTDPRSRT